MTGDERATPKTPVKNDLDMKLEVVVIPVSDVDRATSFYTGLGWRLDADVPGKGGFRVVQVTPPGSPCSVIFGSNITSAQPGSAQGFHLIVSDIEMAHAALASCGAEMSGVFHDAGGVFQIGYPARTHRAQAMALSPLSVIRTGTAGFFKR
jgi:catechol 2,3-dioxygenase-like lactoylglutathione lyase family enzyme